MNVNAGPFEALPTFILLNVRLFIETCESHIGGFKQWTQHLLRV